MTFQYLPPYHLKRRGMDLGLVSTHQDVHMPNEATIIQTWKNDQAIVLPQLLFKTIPDFQPAIQC